MRRLIEGRWLRERTKVSPWRNLAFLGIDHLCVLVAFGAAVAFDLWRRSEGLAWGWNALVWVPAAAVIGVVQHRIGLMGHEASHFLLHPNRRWNDLLADWLCFYPVFGTLANYRAKHLEHHLHPNDPEMDPNLGGGKLERFYAHFPMAKQRFLRRYCLGFFWPPFILANLLDLIRVVMLGGGAAAQARRKRAGEVATASERRGKRSPASRLGLVYFVTLAVVLRVSNITGFPVLVTFLGVFSVATVVWALLPQDYFTRTGTSPVTPKGAAFSRMGCYSLLLGTTALIWQHTGYQCAPALLLLWFLPLIYVFPYLMLVREVFQHANAGSSELDNSRIINVGPVMQWALLAYGNDYHLIHHLYPNIPCYRLREVHRHLTAESPEYRHAVMETHGLHASAAGSETLSLLESLARIPGEGGSTLPSGQIAAEVALEGACRSNPCLSPSARRSSA